MPVSGRFRQVASAMGAKPGGARPPLADFAKLERARGDLTLQSDYWPVAEGHFSWIDSTPTGGNLYGRAPPSTEFDAGPASWSGRGPVRLHPKRPTRSRDLSGRARHPVIPGRFPQQNRGIEVTSESSVLSGLFRSGTCAGWGQRRQVRDPMATHRVPS